MADTNPTEGKPEEEQQQANAGEGEDNKVYTHPETGEVISKNAWKKLMKGAPPKKEKKEKLPPPPAAEKKEKKPQKEKKEEKIPVDETAWGDFKTLGDLPDSYYPKYVEAAWQGWWEKSGFYQPNVEKALESGEEDKFVMVIPPPNVTGSLHLGHALMCTIEDTLTRWHRMNGKVTLWLPGVDHAGIATQSVVERMLMKKDKVTRHDLGREAFTKKVWEWKEQYGNRITSQLRFLGASVDWSREAFTMDPTLSRAVTEAFVRFHEDGLIYRDTRLINWSCALQSALSDIEVDFIDIKEFTYLAVPNHTKKEKYEFGTLTAFAYKVDGSDEEIVVATTRLETMLGDTAVAVHPDDERYKHLHGKFLVHPFVDRKIPIVTDPVLVDMAFGTGAVKVTPAHDPNDYSCGKRHNLEFIVMLTEDGKIAANGGQFAGLMRYDARIAVEEELKKLGLFRGKTANPMRLGLCSRTNDIIEPMLTPQWYVNCSNMAKRSVDAVRNGDLKILPQSHEQTWYMWLENIRDWCISRQLWWGHRIPAYFVRLPGETAQTMDQNDSANDGRWFVGRTEAEARAKAAAKLGVDGATLSLTQDEDVLDTWFSSGLFPFSVFGWPEDTVDLKAFFPTTLLETGLDILFFWVARMVMMSLQLTDQLPFKTVYLHSMVRDKYGRKMSKALGNVVDPLEVINGCNLEHLLKKIDEGNLPQKEVAKAKEAQSADFPNGIQECGADALRFGLLAYTAQGRDINLDIQRVVGYRQFCNKIWNAFKLVCNYVNSFYPIYGMQRQILYSTVVAKRDRWILSRLNQTTKECQTSLANYAFANATTALFSFFLYDFCDVYLELVKPGLNTKLEDLLAAYPESEREQHKAECEERLFQKKRVTHATLYTVLEQYLRLLHPFMPFITEELWQRLPNRKMYRSEETIMTANYPKPDEDWEDVATERNMEVIKEAIHSARSLRSTYRIANNVKAKFFFKTDFPSVRQVMEEQADDFCTLAKGESLQFIELPDGSLPKGHCITVVSDQLSLLVDLTGLIEVDIELQRLQKEIDRLTPMINTYQRKISAKDYETKVPEDVRQQNQEKLNSYQVELDETMKAIKMFESMKI